MATGGGLGGRAPCFCQDGSRDFLKIDEKIDGGGGSSKSSEKQRTWLKIPIYAPHFYSPAHASGLNNTQIPKYYLSNYVEQYILIKDKE